MLSGYFIWLIVGVCIGRGGEERRGEGRGGEGRGGEGRGSGGGGGKGFIFVSYKLYIVK